MGYEIGRFDGEVDEELICSVCSGVLYDPLQVPQCEHAFCAGCIQEWLTRQPTCPVDRSPVTFNQLKPVPRILRNLLARLEIRCDNASDGCASVLSLESLPSHLLQCDFNPKKLVPCAQGCGVVIPKDELQDHNCMKELRHLVNRQQQKMSEMQSEIVEAKLQLTEQKQDLLMLKELVRSSRGYNTHVQEVPAFMENGSILRWVGGLPTARVTRWGSIISTPDAVLQDVIKRALLDSGCPSHIVMDLIEYGNERCWPRGLCTLETRQLNRRQYESYVSKRIPGKQAVVVMHCENQHMSNEFIIDPGLVMIFAHGVV